MRSFTELWPTLKRLLAYGSPWRKPLAIAVAMMWIAAAAEVSGPLLISYFIDNMVAKHTLPLKLVAGLAAAYIGLQLLAALLHYSQSLLFNRAAVGVVQQLRSDVMDAALHQPLSEFDTQPVGQLISRVTNDTEVIRDLYVTVVATVLRSAALIGAMLVAMFSLDWRMALVAIAIFPAVLIVMIIYQRYSTPIVRRVRAWLADINDGFNEVINGMGVIQQFRQQARFGERMREASYAHYLARMQTLRLDGFLLRPLLSLFSSLVLCRQRFNLPAWPTTTIGSFPQTTEIRGLRLDFKKGNLDASHYRTGIAEHIKQAIVEQERLGLDVLVHGEAERNDMVEYFGEHLDGFIFTQNGWVQSYGSRCVKPPVVIGDVSRPQAITVEWAKYAQSLTDKPVKGMLTGPVTILCWSFPREDVSRETIAKQIALALRDEVADLEAAGIGIIQIDEPALREGLPLKRSDWDAYLQWGVEAFRLNAAVAKDDTQIHTHMCYCEFNDIMDSIAALDADVITIETSRSDMELLESFEVFEYPNEIGPGVYDIHSPNVPSVEWIEALLEKAAQRIPAERLWVNPDCGLKTRGWPETRAALANMVQAARNLRQSA